MKLVLPLEALAGPIPVPGPLMRFVGIAETLGAIGLIAPGALRIARGLTPVAAGALAILMIGATEITILGGGGGAVVPFVVGLQLGAVLYGRRSWLAAGGTEPRLDRSDRWVLDEPVPASYK